MALCPLTELSLLRCNFSEGVRLKCLRRRSILKEVLVKVLATASYGICVYAGGVP
jgi:hypothetical protein